MPGQSIAGMVFKPWDQRDKTTNELQPVLQQELNKIAGVRVAAFQPPPLPGSIGLPVQFVIMHHRPFERLNDVAQQFLQQALQSGMFIFLDCDLKIDNPQSNVIIDRDKTAQLGLKMSDVGGALAAMLGGGYVNYFSISGRSYKVIPQVQQHFRLNPQQLLDYYIRTADGSLVPLSTVARSRPRRCRNRSITSSSSTARRSRASPCPAWRRATRWRSCRTCRRACCRKAIRSITAA